MRLTRSELQAAEERDWGIGQHDKERFRGRVPGLPFAEVGEAYAEARRGAGAMRHRAYGLACARQRLEAA